MLKTALWLLVVDDDRWLLAAESDIEDWLGSVWWVDGSDNSFEHTSDTWEGSGSDVNITVLFTMCFCGGVKCLLVVLGFKGDILFCLKVDVFRDLQQ